MQDAFFYYGRTVRNAGAGLGLPPTKYQGLIFAFKSSFFRLSFLFLLVMRAIISGNLSEVSIFNKSKCT